MKKNITTFAPFLWVIVILMTAVACDEGDIRDHNVTYAQGGFSVKLSGRFTGLGEWDDGYSVVLAAFNGQDRVYDMGEMRITPDCEGRDTTIIWNNINRGAQSVELCVVNKLRRRMATLRTADVDENADTVYLNVGEVNTGLFGAVQSLFNMRCAGCHGGGNYANLKLDSAHAYPQLVNIPAHRPEFGGAMRVAPGNPAGSALYQMLDPSDERGNSVLMFQHKAAFTEDDMSQTYALSIIGKWIGRVR
ncbi:MAG: hypothetical protein K6F94_06635 [Bacteroidaceae bacterium]|nr:hypothetical protein [Bacteroidaceae bacterium]